MTDDEIKTYGADEYGLSTTEERNAFMFGWKEAQKKAGKIIMELKREVKTLGDLVDEYFIDDENTALRKEVDELRENRRKIKVELTRAMKIAANNGEYTSAADAKRIIRVLLED